MQHAELLRHLDSLVTCCILLLTVSDRGHKLLLELTVVHEQLFWLDLWWKIEQASAAVVNAASSWYDIMNALVAAPVHAIVSVEVLFTRNCCEIDGTVTAVQAGVLLNCIDT